MMTSCAPGRKNRYDEPHVKLMFLGFYFIALALPVCAGLVIAAERVVSELAPVAQSHARIRLAVRRADGCVLAPVNTGDNRGDKVV
jgi:hypothetical protein